MKTEDDEFLTFRATFEYPKPQPERMQLRIKGPIEVEIYREEGRRLWRAREPKSHALYKISAPSHQGACNQVAALFETQLSEWRAYSFGTPVDELPAGHAAKMK